MERISPVYARIVLREILRQGIPPETLLAGTSLTRSKLERSGDISMEDFLIILENGDRLIENEQLGLIIGRHSNIIVLGPTGTAAAIAPTLREGLQVLENYTRLHVSYMGVNLQSSLSGLSILLHYLIDIGTLKRFHEESGMLLLQHYVESVTGAPLESAEYRMSYPRPDYAGQYDRCMHSAISFNWPQASMVLPGELLDLPSPYYNAELWEQTTLDLARRIKELEGRDDRPYTQYVDALMRACEPPLPDLADVAQRLHMSERTLNRRLQNEGTGFRQIKAELLDSWARQHLEETQHTVEAIAASLGYQDAANFRRAFRKNQGCSPAEYRRQRSTD